MSCPAPQGNLANMERTDGTAGQLPVPAVAPSKWGRFAFYNRTDSMASVAPCVLKTDDFHAKNLSTLKAAKCWCGNKS